MIKKKRNKTNRTTLNLSDLSIKCWDIVTKVEDFSGE